MADYKHGTYGNLAESVGGAVVETQSAWVYIGTAPVNLIRGYTGAVNAPILVRDFEAAKRLIGYSDAWENFTLSEVAKLHFDNADGNIGPIVVINVLDPATHRKGESTSVALTFANGRATIKSDTIILDTLVLSDKVEGVDFSIDYDFTKGQVIINSIGTKLTGSVQATYNEVDPSAVDVDDIKGGVTAGGVYTGIGCVGLVYPEIGRMPTHLSAPGWSHHPAIYEALLTEAQKINGHWDAVVDADIPLVDDKGAKIDTIEAAIKWKNDNGYNHERSKVYWPKAIDTAGRVYNLSAAAGWLQMTVDATHDDIPMETASNKPLPFAAKQYFGEGSTNRGFDQQRGNELNAEGITTLVFWGGRWVLWGPHTASYKYGQVDDLRSVFDNNIRMLLHITNSFQAEHALVIDEPMTRAMADTIKNREQEKADALAAIGALIGKPVVYFRETENSTAELAEGNFVWSFEGTPTPPFKSGTLNVAYSSAGFASYFEEV